MKRKILLMSLMVILVMLCAIAITESYQQQVLVYMIGSDLADSTASDDLREMMTALDWVPDDDVCVLILAGGAEQWNGSHLENATVYRLTSSGMNKLATLPEAASMEKSSALEAFLRFSGENFPAQKCGLILWDHGFGPMEGFGLASGVDDDKLTLSEIVNALKVQTYHLDWIGFDACLMGSIETAAALAPYADFLVASEETEPYEGWNYAFLGKLTADMDGASIGAAIVQDYVSFYENKYRDYPYLTPILTLSCTDLKQYYAVESAMNVLFSALAEDIHDDLYNDIVNARNASPRIASFTTGSSYDLVDLRYCSEQLCTFYPEESRSLIDALNTWQVSAFSNQDRLAGLSVYFPFDNISRFLGRWGFMGENIGCSNGYRRFIHEYSEIWMAHKLEEWQPAAFTSEDGEYSMTLTDEQIENLSYGHYIVLEEDNIGSGSYRAIYYGYDLQIQDHRLIAGFNGNMMFATSGDRTLPVLAEKKAEDDEYVYFHLWVTLNSQPHFLDEGNTSQRAIIQIKYDKQNNTCVYTGMIPNGNGELETGKTNMRLEDWTSFVLDASELYMPMMDINGNYLPFDKWKGTGKYVVSELPITQAGDFAQFEFKEYKDIKTSRKYVLLIEATDVYGNCIVSKLISISAPIEESLTEISANYDSQRVELINDENAYLCLNSISWTDSLCMNFTCRNNGTDGINAEIVAIAINGCMVPTSVLSITNEGKLLLSACEESIISIQDHTHYEYEDIRQLGIGSPIHQIEMLLLFETSSGVKNYAIHIDCSIQAGVEGIELLPLISSYDYDTDFIYCDDYIRAELITITEQISGLSFEMRFTNITGYSFVLNLKNDSIYIDNYLIQERLNDPVLLSYSSIIVSFEIDYSVLWRIESGLSFDIFCSLILRDYFSSELIEETEEFEIHFSRREAPFVLDSDGFRLQIMLQNTDRYLKRNTDAVFILYAENSTFSHVEMEIREIKINGTKTDSWFRLDLPAQCKSSCPFYAVSIIKSVLNEMGVPLENLTATLTIWNADTKVEIGTYEIVLYND